MSMTYNLQLRHGVETKNFTTREEVIAYIKGQIEYGNTSILPYEPILFFYGEEDSKKAIILVGLPENQTYEGKSYFLVDTAELQEKIDTIDGAYDNTIEELKTKDKELEDAVATEKSKREQNVEELKAADEEIKSSIDLTKADLMSVIEACGLIYNEKLSEDKVSYEPDRHDDIIGDSETIADAVDKISKFVASLGTELKFTVDSTDTVKLTLADSKLTADVRIAKQEGLSRKNFDNNILGKTTDGLYVSASIEPSTENPNELVFKTSGYVDGEFKVDAFETPVELPKIKGDNGKTTGVTMDVDAATNTVSAKLNLATDEDNILKLEDGEYIVEGRAKNIKYGDITVAQALKNHANKISDIEDSLDEVKKIDIGGVETDTADVTVYENKGTYTINTDVKLSSDNSIVIANGGLQANVKASYTSGNSTLTLHVGNEKYDVDLSELAVSVLESAEYDSDNEEIVLTFTVGDGTKTLRIPVDRLIHDTTTENTESIKLTMKSVSGGPNVLSGELKVNNRKTDNILIVTKNGAYVSKQHITEAVEAEAKIAREAEQENSDAIKVINGSEVTEGSIAYAKAKAVEAAQYYTDEQIKTVQSDVTKKLDDVKSSIEEKADKTDIPTKVSQLENDAQYITLAEVPEVDLTDYAKTIDVDTKLATKLDKSVYDTFVATYASDKATFATNDSVATAIEKETARAEAKEEAIAKDVATNTANIEKKANASDVYTKEEVTTKLADYAKTAEIQTKLDEKLGIETAKSTYATIDSVNTTKTELEKSIKENADAVGKIELKKENDLEYTLYVNGTQHGGFTIPKDQFLKTVNYDSTSKKLVFVFNTTDGEKTTEVSVADLVDTYVAGDGLVLNGNSFCIDTTSVATNDSVTTAIEKEAARAEAKEEAIAKDVATNAATIEKKANASDVYTKEETLKTLADYAKTADVQSKLDEKLNTTVAETTYATKEALQDVKDKYATKEYVDSVDTQLSDQIKSNKTNIDNFGLTYNSATSELVYTDKNGNATTHKLYSGSLIKKGEFDTKSNSIVLTIENAGIESQITIPVSELLSDVDSSIKTNASDIQKINEAIAKLAKDWTVQTSDTVALTKSTVGEKDNLTASVIIATSNKQAIQSTGNGLYVSNDLQDYTCVYGEEGTISAQTAISKLLAKTQNSDEINNLNTDLTELKTQVNTNKTDIATLKNQTADISSLKTQVATNTTDIASLKSQSSDISSLKEQVTKNTTNIGYLDTRVSNLETKVTNAETRLATIEGNVTKLGDRITTVEGNITELTRDITTINEYIENITKIFGDLEKNGITDIATELAKIKTVTGYDSYTNEKNLPTRIEALEAEDVIIATDLIGDKASPKEGSVWHELNNIVDAGSYGTTTD